MMLPPPKSILATEPFWLILMPLVKFKLFKLILSPSFSLRIISGNLAKEVLAKEVLENFFMLMF